MEQRYKLATARDYLLKRYLLIGMSITLLAAIGFLIAMCWLYNVGILATIICGIMFLAMTSVFILLRHKYMQIKIAVLKKIKRGEDELSRDMDLFIAETEDITKMIEENTAKTEAQNHYYKLIIKALEDVITEKTFSKICSVVDTELEGLQSREIELEIDLEKAPEFTCLINEQLHNGDKKKFRIRFSNTFFNTLLKRDETFIDTNALSSYPQESNARNEEFKARAQDLQERARKAMMDII